MIDHPPSAQDMVQAVKTAWEQPIMRRSILFGTGMGVIAFILVIVLLSVTLPGNGGDSPPLPTVVLQIDQEKSDIDRQIDAPPTELIIEKSPEPGQIIPDDDITAQPNQSDPSDSLADGPPEPDAPMRRDRVIITRVGDDLDRMNFPAGVAFAFFPNAIPDRSRLNQIQQSGHDIFLHLPMEPADFPSSNPGPDAILTNRSPSDNVTRLRDMLELADWDGILIYQGGAILRDGEQLGALLPVIGSKNLPIYVTNDQQTAPLNRMAAGYRIPLRTVEPPIHPTDDPTQITAEIARAMQPDSLITIQLPNHPLISKRIDITGQIEDNT
jgi:polysaccharide deacetylase 2 family uncharacterized protein YibQ